MKSKQYNLVFHIFCLALLLPYSLNAAAQPTTTRISVGSSGNPANNWSHDPPISANGRYVAFESDADNLVLDDNNSTRDVFIRDRMTDITTRVSVDSSGNDGNEESYTSAISGDGHYVAFASLANDLITLDSNGMPDVFVRGPLIGFPWEMFLPTAIINKP